MGYISDGQNVNLQRQYVEESHMAAGEYMQYYMLDRAEQSKPENYDPLYNESTTDKKRYRMCKMWGAWNNNNLGYAQTENGVEMMKTRTIFFSFLQMQKNGLDQFIKIGEQNVGDIVKCGDGYFEVLTCAVVGYSGDEDKPLMFQLETKRNYKYVGEQLIDDDILVVEKDPTISADHDETYQRPEDIPISFVSDSYFPGGTMVKYVSDNLSITRS
jgi:hypothetical protein